MYTLYKIGKTESKLLVVSSELYDFGGIRKRFQEMSHTVRAGDDFVILENGRPYELWAIRDSDDIVPASEVRSLLSASQRLQSMYVEVNGGVEYLRSRLANSIPGYLGKRLLLTETPQTNCFGHPTWPKIEKISFWAIAAYMPQDYLALVYGRAGNLHHKEVEVNHLRYVVQVVAGCYHVFFTTKWRWAGKFKVVLKDKQHHFQVVSINHAWNLTDPRPQIRESKIQQQVYANSQKGAIREIVKLVSAL